MNQYQKLIKAGIVLGGGMLLFLLFKPRKGEVVKPAKGDTKSFDNAPAPTIENAQIVMDAYTEALKNGEPPARLSELNKECMNEFGLRCYVEPKTGQLIVCDTKGEPVLTK